MFITVVDLEWMSWKGNYLIRNNIFTLKREKWQKRELIQIGCVKYNEANFQIVDELKLYVKPRHNVKLNSYISKLLNLNQSFINTNGIRFDCANKKLYNFVKNSKAICNGQDFNVYQENLILNNLNTRSFKIYNIRELLKKKYNFNEINVSSPNLSKDKSNRLVAHDALDDAKSIFYFLKEKNFSISQKLSPQLL